MHQPASPLTSGRTVLWRTMPVLFIAPILSTLVNRWELAIYLPVTYGFLIIAFVQYRRLCREWATWTTRIPSITEEDILAWYGTKLAAESSTQLAPREDLAERDDSSLEQTSQGPADLKQAVSAFRAAVHLYARIGVKIPLLQNDPVVVRVAKGMPYAEWLLKKECRGTGALPEPFSATWFSTLRSATKKQAEMTMGLKEHSTLMLWRQSKYDVSQRKPSVSPPSLSPQVRLSGTIHDDGRAVLVPMLTVTNPFSDRTECCPIPHLPL